MENISEILIWIFMFFQLIIILMLCKLIGEFLNKVSHLENKGSSLGLLVGQQAPLFREYDHQGKVITIQENKKTVLLFVQESCSTCMEVLQNLKEAVCVDQTVLVVSKESLQVQKSTQENVSYIKSVAIFNNYFISYTPSLVIVNEHGAIEVVEHLKTSKEFLDILNINTAVAS